MRLLPGVRLVDRPDALHFFNGRRVVSVRGELAGRDAVRRVLGLAATDADDVTAVRPSAGRDDGVRAENDDAAALLSRFNLVTPETAIHGSAAADFTCAVVSGQVTPDVAARRLASTVVYVWDDDRHELRDHVTAAGLTTQSIDNTAHVVDLDPERSLVLVVDSENHPGRRMAAVNEMCLSTGVPWLPVGAFDGAVLRIGPLIIPGQTACFHCLNLRLAANVAYPELHAEMSSAPSAPTSTALRTWSYSVAALIALHWTARREPELPGRLYTLDPLELTIRPSSVFRVPRCLTCGAPGFLARQAPWQVGHDH